MPGSRWNQSDLLVSRIDLYTGKGRTHPSGTGTSSRFWTLHKPLFSSPSFSSSSSKTGSTTAIIFFFFSALAGETSRKWMLGGIGSPSSAPLPCVTTIARWFKPAAVCVQTKVPPLSKELDAAPDLQQISFGWISISTQCFCYDAGVFGSRWSRKTCFSWRKEYQVKSFVVHQLWRHLVMTSFEPKTCHTRTIGYSKQ